MPPRLSATAPWARAAWGVDDTPAGLIVIRATRRLGRLRLDPVTAGPPRHLPARDAVAACLRQRDSFIRRLEAPLASPSKALRVFPALLDVQIPFPVEDCVFDILDPRAAPDGRSTRALAAGGRHADIGRRLQALDAAGVTPHVLDQECLALWSQALKEYPAGPADPRAVVYESDDRLTLAVGRGDELLGAHTFRGFEAETLQRNLRLYFPEPPPALSWIWAGPSARDAAAVRVRHGLLAARWPGPLTLPTAPEAFLARALARRALTAGRLRFNARRARHAHPAVAQRERRAPFKAAAACLAVGLLLCAVNLAWATAARHRLAGVQERLRRTAIRVAGSERLVPRNMERLGAQRAFDERVRLAAPLLAPFRSPPTVAVGRILKAAQEEALRVQTVSATRTLVTLRGTAPAWANGERLVRRLEREGWRVTADRKGESGGPIPVVITAEASRDP